MRAIEEIMEYIRGSITFVVWGTYNDIHHNKAFSIMILSNPDGVGWLKFSKTASRIAPSSTARTEDFSSKFIHCARLTEKYWKDSAFNPKDRCVQVLSIAVDV